MMKRKCFCGPAAELEEGGHQVYNPPPTPQTERRAEVVFQKTGCSILLKEAF